MPSSVLILQGDAEARLFARAGETLQACFPGDEVRVTHAWTTRSDLMRGNILAPLGRDPLSGRSVAELLEDRHDLVVFSTVADATLPVLRGPRGSFVAHRELAARWSDAERAAIESEYVDGGLLDPVEAVKALEQVVDELQARGQIVAICTVFRHVNEALDHREPPDRPSLRARILATNVEIARLSHRTGCFVLDLDRALAHEGGVALGADCFGGSGPAEDLALEELITLVLEAMPPADGGAG